MTTTPTADDGPQTAVDSRTQIPPTRRAAPPIQLFASSPSDPRARRTADAVRAVGDVLLLLLTALLSQIASDLDRRISGVLLEFPGFLKVFWLIGFWGAVGWSLALLVITAFRDRLKLTAEAVVAGLLALGIVLIAAAIVSGDTGDVLRRLADSNGPPVFPPGVVAITSAVIAAMAPHLTLPFRRLGRAFVAAQLIGSLFLGVTQTFGAVASLAIGLLAGNVIHLVRGSPGGLPTITRVSSALGQVGIEVDQLAPVAILPGGVATFAGSDLGGALEVKVYGRDAWEGELVASLWRVAWYRGSQRSARLSRGEYVEHEGFMTYLAADAGVRVPEVVTAGLADNGDALIVFRRAGTPLTDATALTAEQTRSLWDQLGRLHDRGIIHRRIDLDRVDIGGDGSVGFSDLSSATVQSNPLDKLADRAQLLTLTGLMSSRTVAVEQARSALGDADLTAVLPALQEAAMPPLVRSALRRRHVVLDDIRKELGEQLGAPDVEPAQLRRVTWKSLLNLALLAVAAYTLIGMISGLDLGAFGRALADANWWWLAAALLIGQLPRVANALSTMGSTPQPLPFGPTTAMQFAICYVNLAVPSSAGRIAVTTRFYQRFGVPPAAALSAGAIDSLSEFIVQIALFTLVFFVSDLDLGLSLNTDQLSGIGTVALIIIVALIVVAVIAVLVPSLRQRMLTSLRQARDAVRGVASPHKLGQLFGGNLLAQLLFAVTMGACVRAFGFQVPLSSLILINTAVALFAGLMPVPGGVGVSEAGFSLGLTRAGIPAEIAFAIALAYRFVTFYLPPIWGFRSYRWLTARRYL
jgi:uncharacterized membrane protein YbhN (UPF0104 family)/tRNA A-37 threonylcarbamoyl transferase component Bud32